MLTKVDYTRFPRVQIWRRGVAFGIDFFCAWLLSSLLGANFLVAQIFIFILAWLGLRVFWVYNNQGQSLGRWALDMKLLDTEFSRVPGLQALLKREGFTGFEAVFAAIALSNIRPSVGIIFLILPLALLPLAIDCSAALSDIELRQAFHDRVARTMIVSSRRGYSLDIKVKRLLAQVRRSVRK